MNSTAQSAGVENSAATVPWSIRSAYAAPALALAVVGIPVYVYLPKFYTDTVGLDIGIVGAILLAVRLFDAVSDPAVGLLSDRGTSKAGRRRPWIAWGAPLLCIALLALFIPPNDLQGTGLTLWFAASVFTLFLFWTCITVPYESLGPELSFDYDERTSIMALRDGALIGGTLIAAIMPAVLQGIYSELPKAEQDRAVFRGMAYSYVPIILAACAWCLLKVREAPPESRPTPEKWSFQQTKNLMGNRPFLILLASYTVAALGSNLPATMIPYYVEYVLKAEGAEGFLLLYFLVGIVLLPFWVWLSGKIGKKPAWITAVLINTLSFFCVFWLGEGDTTAYAVLVCLSGIGFGATVALPSAMQADVIDYEELRCGERREGAIIGIWSVAKKLAAALGVGIALMLLGWAGYEANQAQSESVVLLLRALYAAVPCALGLLGLSIAFLYPIDRQMHQKIREQCARRSQGEAWHNPLD